MRAWLDGFDVEVGRALEVKTGYGAKVFADAANVSLRTGERVIERGRTLTCAAGDRGGGQCRRRDRRRTSTQAPERCARSTTSTAASSQRASTLSSVMRGRCRRTSSSGDCGSRCAACKATTTSQQKKSIRWRSWVERISGMFRGDFACDPLNAVKIDKRIQDEIDRLFAERVARRLPDDPDREAEVPRRARSDLAAARAMVAGWASPS